MYLALSQELLRRLRGRRSQRAFAKHLGFESNVAYSWESGRRSPEVSVFLRTAELSNPNLRVELMHFIPDCPLQNARLASPKTVQRLVQHLVGPSNQGKLAERLGVDRTTLARWLKGKTEPRLPEFLHLIDLVTQRLLAFVGLFADPASLKATQAAHRALRAQRKLAYELPWSHAFLRGLELKEYRNKPKHVPGFLASRIGLKLEEEQRYLSELEDAGQVHWDGTHYRIQQVLTVDTREEPHRNRQLKSHWAKEGVARLESASTADDALFSFNLFAISEEAFQRVRDLHLQYYASVRAIIDESPHADRVVLMNLQLIPLENASPSEEQT